jgi:DNA-binding protein H-NS
MKEPDYQNLSVEQLLEMQDKLKSYLTKRLDTKRKEALNKILTLVQEHNLSFEEVTKAIRVTAKRGKAPALYRNPAKPRQTWSGKGEAPEWLSSHPNPEELRIKDN